MLKCALPLFFVIISVAEAGSIIFPGQLDQAEGDTCTTNTGGSGTCSRLCGHSSSLSEPRKCGIRDSRFLFCCDANLGNTSEPFTDVSQPRINFECGRNSRRRSLPFFSNKHRILIHRPDATPPTNDDVGPPFPGEIPEEEQRKLEKRQVVNIPAPAAGGGTDALDDHWTLKESFDTSVAHAVGGVDAVKNGWPWMALLGNFDGKDIKWFCAGVLINERWILTASHCILQEKVKIVRLGEHDYNDNEDNLDHEDFFVEETVFYPDYKPPVAYHDLALIRLDSEVILKEHIRPVCLPWGSESDKNIIDQQATLTGWGDTEYRGFPSSILQEVKVTVFPSAQCDRGYSSLPHYRSTWPRGLGKDILCAGDLTGGRDACQGDSGGPLVSEDARGHFVLAGIVSKGYGCGHEDYPGLYANLRHSPYLAWIKKVAFSAP